MKLKKKLSNKIAILLSLFFWFFFNSYSQTYITTTSKESNYDYHNSENCIFKYNASNNTITFSDNVSTYTYGPVELSKTLHHQGLYFEIYNPTVESLFKNKSSVKRIHKFGYDKKGGNLVVIEVTSFKSESISQTKAYYTDYYFEWVRQNK